MNTLTKSALLLTLLSFLLFNNISYSASQHRKLSTMTTKTTTLFHHHHQYHYHNLTRLNIISSITSSKATPFLQAEGPLQSGELFALINCICCHRKMEPPFSRSDSKMNTPTTSVSSAATLITKAATTLKVVTLALLLLMMPSGTPDLDVATDNHEDGSGDNDDDDDDDDDEDSYEGYGVEGDVLVYTYQESNNNRGGGYFAFLTNVSLCLTWKEVAYSINDDYIIIYNLEPNDRISGDPRFCCYGYFARYFKYNNPWSETDDGEPIQEFTPDQDWTVQVQPHINRINLYPISCNGF